MFYALQAPYPGDLISERRHCLKDSKPSFFGVIYKQSQSLSGKLVKVEKVSQVKREHLKYFSISVLKYPSTL